MNEPNKPFSESIHGAAEAIVAAGAAAGEAAVKLEQAAVGAIEEELARRPRWRTALSFVGWSMVAAYFLFAALVLGLRYWLLPNIGSYTHLIESKVSALVGKPVTIGVVNAGWDGLRPELDLMDVRIADETGRTALSLPAVEAVFSWTSLLVGSLHFHSLAFDKPDLVVRRDATGNLFVAGLQIKEVEQGAAGLSDWLLAQSQVNVRGARILWNDEQRGAPALELSGVGLVLRNNGNAHRFALRASAARELASTLDVRGEFRGLSLSRPAEWAGQLYAELQHIDLGALRRWLDYPFEIQSGQGGLRFWLSFSRQKMTQLTGDVALAGVLARASADVPPLELDFLRGRLGASEVGGITEVFGRQLSLRTRGGVALPPVEFSLRLPGRTDENSAQRGEFIADALELQPLAQLAEFLPFPAALRQRLDESAPRGSLRDIRLTWQGDIADAKAYSLRSRFAGLAMRAHRSLPGFSGLSGSVTATEKSGSIILAKPASKTVAKTTIDLQNLLRDGPLSFDSLSGRLSWSLATGKEEIRFQDVAFSNAELAGTLAGSFLLKPESKGVIDLSAGFSRVDGRQAWRYIPLMSEGLRDYLQTAVVAGQSRDTQLRIKGDLDHFPFDDPKQGRFQVTARISDGELIYARGWPRIAGIAGDLILEGRRLTIRAQRGSILGARLSNVRATIPDVLVDEEQLGVEGQADGPTAEFLRFIDSSPVAVSIGNATRAIRASGNGRLTLKLDMLLRKPEATRLAGSFQFLNNQVTISPELPDLTQASGRLDFNESGMAVKGMTGQFLGGPLLLNAQTRDGSLSLTAQGTTALASVRRLAKLPALEYASGSASWRSTINARGDRFDFALDSPLQGVAINLPPPFGKTAAEVLPLRLERSNGTDAQIIKHFRGLRPPPGGDMVLISLGSAPPRSVQALFARRLEGGESAIDRGVVALNEAATAPTQPGIAVRGTLGHVDVDRWRAALAANPAPRAAGASTAAVVVDSGPTPLGGLTAVNLKIAALDLAGKRFNNVGLNAIQRGSQWSASVNARELKGEIRWHPEGRGLVQARLSHLITPEDRPPAAGEPPPEGAKELPALDVIAESFTLRNKQLGRLELVAVNDARDWRIEKLVLNNPESSLRADGVWQSWAARPSTSVNVKLETSDLGKYLERMGYPAMMAGGTARLEGKIGWVGSPQSPDFSTLGGNLVLSAEKGRFLKADPGVAKLLGVLSLQTLVTLDFRDLFREGFTYDSISGSALVSKGVLTTQDFSMKGPSAGVRMSGNIDLARETQNLRVRVVPSLGDSASTVAGFLLNPIFGLGATIVNRILKDPLGQIFAVEYDVTGGWDDPKVVRTRIEAPQDQEQSGD